MPLIQSASKAARQKNIEEMISAGHPPRQAVAASYRAQRDSRRKRAGGGELHLSRPTIEGPKLHIGPIHSGVAGRTDHLPMHVPEGSYVLPADIISAMGEGNSVAGFKITKRLPRLFATSFYGQKKAGEGMPYGGGGLPYGAVAPPHKATGGEVDRGVAIAAAGGEHVFGPDEVRLIGNGDLDNGHRILDEFVKAYRAQTIKTLKKLPGPRRD